MTTRSANNSPVAGVSGPSSGKSQTVFIHKLFDMLEDRSLAHLIWWSPTQDSFFLYPGEEFSNVLAQYFKHTNIASFIRQLNMYGFHKVNDNFQNDDKHASDAHDQGGGAQQQPHQTRWEFRHSANHFRKGDVESLSLIKRKSSKVASSHKEIVSLKTLPPTSDAPIEDLSAAKEQPHAQEQYHLSIYQQLWNQLGVPGGVPGAIPGGAPGSVGSKENARPGSAVYGGVAPVLGPYAYPVYAQGMGVPHLPLSPAGSEPVVGSPSYFLHLPLYPPTGAAHLQPSLRQASVLEQSVNFKMAELTSAVHGLKVAYLDLLARHESLSLLHQKSQAELAHLTQVVDTLAGKLKAEETSASASTGAEPVDRKLAQTPVARIISPGPDSMSPTSGGSTKTPVPSTELGGFRSQLKGKLASTTASTAAPKQGYSLTEHLGTARVSMPAIVPQAYPLNPNYTLYNSSDAPLRQAATNANSEEAAASKTTIVRPAAHRQVSVLMDPLQPVPQKVAVRTLSVAPAPNDPSPPAKAHPSTNTGTSATPDETPAYVQPYQPFAHAHAHAYFQHMVHDPSQLRTSSLPVMLHPLPQRLAAAATPQRHSLNLLVHPQISRDDEGPVFTKTPGDEPNKKLPSMEELNKSLRSTSPSARMFPIHSAAMPTPATAAATTVTTATTTVNTAPGTEGDQHKRRKIEE